MKLATLTRMAKLAIDELESGNETAAEELRTFVLEHVDEIAECLGIAQEHVCDPITSAKLEDVPKLIRNTCKLDRIRESEKSRGQSKRDSVAGDACIRLAGGVDFSDISYRFQGGAFASLAKALRPTDTIAIAIEPAPGIRSSECCRALRVPVRCLKGIDKVHPLARCSVTMVSPAYGEWKLVVRWSDVGYWQTRIVDDMTASWLREYRPTVISVPSATEMVSRELGCAEVAA
jgi:hypothetical protein